MRSISTCNTCTVFDKITGKYNQTPDSKCEVRATCPDDASTTTKQKEILYEITNFDASGEAHNQPIHDPAETTWRLQEHRDRLQNQNQGKNYSGVA